MNMEYSAINTSPTINLAAAEALKAPQAVALTLTASGVKLPAAGGDVVGIALPSNADTVAAGDGVDIQVTGFGKIVAGGAFDAGDLLAADAEGKAIKAATGNVVIARAIDAATASGDLVNVQILVAGAKA